MAGGRRAAVVVRRGPAVRQFPPEVIARHGFRPGRCPGTATSPGTSTKAPPLAHHVSFTAKANTLEFQVDDEVTRSCRTLSLLLPPRLCLPVPHFLATRPPFSSPCPPSSPLSLASRDSLGRHGRRTPTRPPFPALECMILSPSHSGGSQSYQKAAAARSRLSLRRLGSCSEASPPDRLVSSGILRIFGPRLFVGGGAAVHFDFLGPPRRARNCWGRPKP